MGPTYCETPLGLFVFPAEPINTLSNLVIIGFGLIALYLVYRRAPRAADLWAVALFLTGTGIGSLLWHGFRTSTFLTLDFTPGILCLLALILAWARRLFDSWLYAVLWVVGFFALVSGGSSIVGYFVDFRFFFAGPLIATLAIGGYFMVLSYRKWGRVTTFALLGMATALLALFFRTLDPLVCSYIPFGTHFLWHILLSGGSFLCILFLLKINEIQK